MGRSLSEMLQYLEVCARAGYLERAEKLLHRIEKYYPPDSKEVGMAQNVILREMVGSAIRNEDEPNYRSAQRHFEARMTAQGIDVDAHSLATLISGSLRFLTGKQRERTIRRYLEYAHGRKLDVFDRDYYDEQQYALLQEILNSGIQSSSIPDSAEIEESIKREEGDRSTVPADFLPEVRAVQLKGLGLKTLKRSLEAVSTENVQDEDIIKYIQEIGDSQTDMDRDVAQQIMIERDATSAALDRWRVESDTMKKMGISTTLHTKAMSSLMWEWHSSLVPALKEELEIIRKLMAEDTKTPDARLRYGPFMQSVDPEKLSALTIIHVLNMLGIQGAAGGLRLANITKTLGAQVEIESDLQALGGGRTLDHLQKLPGKRRAKVNMKLNTARFQPDGHRAGKNIMQHPATTPHLATESPAQSGLNWSADVRVKLGAVLISKLLDTAKISVSKEHPKTKEILTQLQPAFYHAYHYQQGRRLGRIAGNPALIEKLSSEPPAALLAKRLPMIVEPRPWTGYAAGGYFTDPVSIVRQKSPDNVQRSYTLAAIERGDMDQVFAGLDILGKTAWRINQDVLRVQLQAWGTGEAIAKLAPENPMVEYPPEPPKDANRPELLAYRKAREAIDDEKNGFHSQRCFQNFQLEIARAYRDKVIYFPHNIDFRGRAYPIPPYLNHMGADNARGILIFAQGKELGEDGLRWLKVHLANVFGYDKASLKEREDFTMDHLQDIRDAVSKPLDGKGWWLRGEDPWQTLAACFELVKALDSPDPTKFVSHLPVHQDGTCNGLQHYAALGGDTLGAAQVNLEPGDRPADIYTAVAEMVREQCAKDAAEGHKYANIVLDKITRKVVKQTVMTNVYGVTFIGARDQVWRQLEDLLPNLKNTVQICQCASYLAINIFKALSTMFDGAHRIQHWFGQCADRISKSITAEQLKRFRKQSEVPKATQELPPSKYKRQAKPGSNTLGFKSSVIWTTPLRMPVVQPYRTSTAKVVPTTLQSISIVEPQSWDPVSRRKQMGGFAPNFIHSLDATHMLLSALKCDELGMTFASVHDSFWTHAGDVPAMNRVLRDAFVRMHSEDIVGRLAAEFEARHKGGWYCAAVYARSKVGRKIKEWRKNNKIGCKNTAETRTKELLMEQNRLRALKSEDEAERKQAEAMETPTTIFAAEEGDKEAFLVTPETAELGNVDASDNRAVLDSLESDVDERHTKVDQRSEPAPLTASPEALENVAVGDNATSSDSNPMAELPFLKKPKKYAKVEPKLQIWLPLTFPPVPSKGDFDVSRLKESQYFFS
ncbi:MAG: DNA-directed RNA polymerase [Bathelium mastoideum]|nr:MAG: DNA-directed RNA polymerase [Bathelium mastoideum]